MAKIARHVDSNTGSLLKDFKDCLVKDGADSVSTISTGSISFDKATAIGGLPRGKIVELFGVESSSKTTFALHVIANAQRAGVPCAFIDNERTLSKNYAKMLGVDTKKLFILEPENMEQTLQMIYQLNSSKELEGGVVVWDSIGLTPLHGELHEQVDKSHMGDRAQLLWAHSRRIQSIAKTRNVLNLYLNQTTESFSPWETFNTPGGNGLKFACTMRIQLVRGQKQAIKKNSVAQEPWGIAINLTMMKNKMGMPHRKAQTILRFGVGYDEIYEVIEFGIKSKVIEQKGGWFAYNEKNIAQGKESLRVLLSEDKKLYKEIKGKIL